MYNYQEGDTKIYHIDGRCYYSVNKYRRLEKENEKLKEEIKNLEESNEMLKKQVADEELYNKLCEIDNRCGSDSEARHVEADELLTECLRTLGFNKAMDKYKWMEFRYS